MKMKFSKSRLLGAGIVLACVGMGWWAVARLSPPRLMEHAVLVATLDEVANARSSCAWISNEDLLLFQATPSDAYRLVRHHLSDRKEVPLPALTQWFNITHGNPNWSTVSPNGKWLAWEGVNPSSGRIGSCLAQIDGSQFLFQPSLGRVPVPAWAADSRHWFVWNSKESYNRTSRSLVIGDVTTPSVVQTVNIAPTGGVGSAVHSMFSYTLGEFDPTWIWQPNAIQILASLPDARSNPLPLTDKFDALLEFKHIADLQPAATHTLPLFSPANVRKLVLAPGGKRLAWVISYKQPSTLSLIRKMWTSKQPAKEEGRNMLSIWEGKVDSTEVNEVGQIEVKDIAILDREPLNLQWLPDGNSLSFEYNKGFYVVPLPKH